MTPKLLGSKGFIASMITRLVPCSAVPCELAKIWSARLSVILSWIAEAVHLAGTCSYQQLEGTGVRPHFWTLPQQKLFSSQQNNSTKNCGPSCANGTLGYKESSFAGAEDAPSLETLKDRLEELWAPQSSWGCPCSLLGRWTTWPLRIPSNWKDSMILCCAHRMDEFSVPCLLL